ncbi:uncharacterized protein LOC123671065 [Harmonia axyridis]|uniref:uncharacterized protein LOC123671065 n=1 Tax=Harmonia axyridis TaxID=115357 RepID=UPI001E279039|nr:uncharacterized protein LOC123671065 [Harmonia axyridis]
MVFQHRSVLCRRTKSMLCDTLVLSHVNYCDVVYDPRLSFVDAKRIQKLQNCCLRLIFGIRRRQPISHTLRLNEWINMKNRSVLTYGVILWGAAPDASVVFLQQKKAIRAIAGVSQRTSCRELFSQYGIMTLPAIYILTCLCSLYKSDKTESFHHDYSTRNRHKWILTQHRIKRTQDSFNFLGIKLLNKLPQGWLELSKVSFRHQMKRFLTKNVFYSIKEFLDYKF